MKKQSDKIVKVSAGAVIVKDGKTLLAQRMGSFNQGDWGSMGGHVEFGETPIEAAIREAKEELGIKIGNLKFVCCINEYFKEKQYVDVIFLADIISGRPRIMESHKISKIGWFPLDDLPEPLFAPIRITLQNLKTGQQYFEMKKN